MMRFAKWLWRKAEERAKDRLLFEIRSMADYHRYRAEVMFLLSKYEPPRPSDDLAIKRGFLKPEFTADQHQAAADALYELERRINPPIEEPPMVIMGMPKL